MERRSEILRRTKETEIKVILNLDGMGNYRISTGLPFLNHMLELFAKHGEIDLQIEGKGDLDVDPHHTVEDIGISLGAALFSALGEKKGIRRYGYAVIPMDEALTLFAIDISGRPHLTLRGTLRGKVGNFDVCLFKDFFQAFANESRTTIHIAVLWGKNPHHKVESMFKAFGTALKTATQLVRERGDIPSTKGIL